MGMTSDTPRTDALIAAADRCPETRVVFLIKNLANLAKELERDLNKFRESSDYWHQRAMQAEGRVDTSTRNIAEEIIEGLKEAKASLSAGDKP